jgi:hypothetical protein
MTYVKKYRANMIPADNFNAHNRGKEFDIRDAGCYVDGSHDDTVNFQATINEAVSNAITTGSGGGTVIVPDTGHDCIVNGALQTNVGGVTYNSQLYMPQKNYTDQGRVSIKIKGETRPNFCQTAGIGGATTPNTGSRIRSTLINGTADGFIIASKGASGNFSSNNYNDCIIEDLAIAYTPDVSGKATMGGIDFSNAGNAIIKNVTIFPFNQNLVNSALPSVSCTGISMPKIACELFNIIENVSLGGFNSGIRIGEHASLHNAFVMCCTYGYHFLVSNIASYFSKVEANWCVNDMYFAGVAGVKIDAFISEWKQAGKWYDSSYTILDPNNYGRGLIYYDMTESDVGWNNTKFTKSGGTGLQCFPIGLANAAAFTVSGSKGSNAALADLITKLVAQGLIIDSTT